MLTFKQVGKTNTDVTLKLSIQTALEREMNLVVATTKGDTALRAAELAKEMGFTGKLVAVSCAYGAKAVDENSLSNEVRDRLHQQGVTVVTAAHALSGAERGISKAFGGVYPVEIMAATLRMFGQGVKVCVEIALMAADCGAIRAKQPVMVVSGTGTGADTACVITPSYTASLLETKINEILCKPALLPQEETAE